MLSKIPFISSDTDESSDMRENAENNFENIIRMSDESVAEESYKNLQEMYDEDDIDFDDPQAVLSSFEYKMKELQPKIIHHVEEIRRKEEETVEGPDENTMVYIIEKNGGKNGEYTIFGGAETLINNIAREYNWTEQERKLILEASEIVADRNNLDRHTLLDTIVICPNEKAYDE